MTRTLVAWRPSGTVAIRAIESGFDLFAARIQIAFTNASPDDIEDDTPGTLIRIDESYELFVFDEPISAAQANHQLTGQLSIDATEVQYSRISRTA